MPAYRAWLRHGLQGLASTQSTNETMGHRLRFLSKISRWDTNSDCEASYGLSRRVKDGKGDRGPGTPPSVTRLLDAETAVKHLPG